MKIRILDRILVALAGLLMVAGGAALAAQLFFGKDVAGRVAQWLTDDSIRAYVIIIGIVIFLIGVYCVMLLFRHKGRNGKFITQKTESGELAISLKALESMVQKCLEQHKEVTAQTVEMENQKGTLVVKISGTVAGGISIPLTVDTLQQQIKQYVTACSGVEVKDILVEIESSGPDAKDAPFAIEAPAAIGLLKGAGEPSPEQAGLNPEQETENAVAEPTETAKPEIPAKSEQTEDELSAAAAAAAMVMDRVPLEEDDRPMHQRLFSTIEEPCVMPMPPKDLEEKKTSEETGTEAPANETKTEDVKFETAKSEDVKGGNAHSDDAKSQASKSEDTKAEVRKPEASQPEAVKDENAKPETSKGEALKGDNTETGAFKPVTVKEEDAKPETSKGETVKSEETEQEPAKPEETKTEEAKAETAEPEERTTNKGKGFFSSRKKTKQKNTAEGTPEIKAEGGIEN